MSCVVGFSQYIATQTSHSILVREGDIDIHTVHLSNPTLEPLDCI